MVRSDRVWLAMAEAFHASSARFSLRLLAALDAAQEAGGDLRGQKSAAMVVVPTQQITPSPVIDLRVDNSTEPLLALRRLEDLRVARESMAKAFAVARDGNTDEALSMLDEVQNVFGPNDLEPTAWAAVLSMRSGDIPEATRRLRRAVAAEPGWLDLVASMPAADLLPIDPEQLEGVLRPLRNSGVEDKT
jgi:uncharacterized Ntn-hydrolase superfamily protein